MACFMNILTLKLLIQYTTLQVKNKEIQNAEISPV